jgi:hypothetical protein
MSELGPDAHTVHRCRRPSRTCKDIGRLQLNDSGEIRICADPSFGSGHRQSPRMHARGASSATQKLATLGRQVRVVNWDRS